MIWTIILSGWLSVMADVRESPLLLVPRLTSVDYESMLGAGTDDKTSYHPRFDFCGKDRADRPDCLFYFKRPSMKHVDPPTPYLIWNGRVVLDYKREAIRALDLPLIISSQIGQEAARLEAMLRSDSTIEWTDILARIVRRGETPQRVSNIQNRLNMSVVRFRLLARLIAYGRRGSRALEIYLSSVMTAEMVVKNTVKELPDVIEGSPEKAYIDSLNLKIGNDSGQAQSNKLPKTSQESNLPGRHRRTVQERLKLASSWAQTQSAWEAKNPAPTPSIYGEMACNSVQAVVAFKLGSLDNHRQDGRLAFKGPLRMEHGAPFYYFGNPRMEEYFGSPAYIADSSLLLNNPNDPRGLLSSPTVTEAQRCLTDFLLEPARTQYRALTLVNTGSRDYKPIVITNLKGSYWEQLRALQRGFEQHWAEVGNVGPPPVLYGLLKLEYDSMTWNSDAVPALTLVLQAIDSCSRTFAIWQRQQAGEQRARLFRQLRMLESGEGDGGGDGDDEGQDEGQNEGHGDDERQEEGPGGGTGSAEVEGDGGAEDLMEVDSEGEQEL